MGGPWLRNPKVNTIPQILQIYTKTNTCMLLRKQIYFICSLKSFIALYKMYHHHKIHSWMSGLNQVLFYKFSHFCCTQQTISSCVNFLGDASTRYNVELLQIYLYNKAFSKGILGLILSGVCSFCVNGVVVQKKVLISFINNNSFDLSNIKFIYEMGSTFINVVLPQKPTFHKKNM